MVFNPDDSGLETYKVCGQMFGSHPHAGEYFYREKLALCGLPKTSAQNY